MTSPIRWPEERKYHMFFPSLQSDRTEGFWGYNGQVARVSIQRHLDACEPGDFWCNWHPSYPWRGTQRSKKKCREGVPATTAKEDYHECVRVPLIKHRRPRVRGQWQWMGGCWSTARAANRGRTLEVDQKMKCNCLRFLICACSLFWTANLMYII